MFQNAIFLVVTGCTNGIGKEYAKQVMLFSFKKINH